MGTARQRKGGGKPKGNPQRSESEEEPGSSAPVVIAVCLLAALAGGFFLAGGTFGALTQAGSGDAPAPPVRKKRTKGKPLSEAHIKNAVLRSDMKALDSALQDGTLPDTEESVVAIVKAVYCGAKKCSKENEAKWRNDLDVLREEGHSTPGTLIYQEDFLDQEIKPLILQKRLTSSTNNGGVGKNFGMWLWNSRILHSHYPPLQAVRFPATNRKASTAEPESIEIDFAGENMEVYSYKSFMGLGPEHQTHTFGGVPLHMSSMQYDGSETMLPDVRAHLRKMEPEWMKLPIKDWNNKEGSAFNSTSARYDQFNVMSAANPDDPHFNPIMVQFKQFVKAGVVNFMESMAEMPEFHINSEYWTGTMTTVKPFPLYIMCWVNNYYAKDGSNNALHWHVHQWPLQGYLSIDSEDSSTLFRSNVEPEKKWRFEHTNGMVRLNHRRLHVLSIPF